MSDTPETDQVEKYDGFKIKDSVTTCGDESSSVYINVIHARQLERERNEARERIERQKLEINRLNGATNHAGGTPLKIALRERDEAREALKHIEEYGTEEINAAVDLRQKLVSALLERDEARKKCASWVREWRELRVFCRQLDGEANDMLQERDEAQEKYDKLATEHMLVVNKLCKERDDALKENQ